MNAMTIDSTVSRIDSAEKRPPTSGFFRSAGESPVFDLASGRGGRLRPLVSSST